MDGFILRLVFLAIVVVVAWILGAGKDEEK